MSGKKTNRQPRLADIAAKQEAAAISNGNLEKAESIASYQSKRTFRRLIDVLLMFGCILVAGVWAIGVVVAFLYFILPPRIVWISADSEHELLSFVSGGLVTSFASSYIQRKIK